MLTWRCKLCFSFVWLVFFSFSFFLGWARCPSADMQQQQQPARARARLDIPAVAVAAAAAVLPADDDDTSPTLPSFLSRPVSLFMAYKSPVPPPSPKLICLYLQRQSQLLSNLYSTRSPIDQKKYPLDYFFCDSFSFFFFLFLSHLLCAIIIHFANERKKNSAGRRFANIRLGWILFSFFFVNSVITRIFISVFFLFLLHLYGEDFKEGLRRISLLVCVTGSPLCSLSSSIPGRSFIFRGPDGQTGKCRNNAGIRRRMEGGTDGRRPFTPVTPPLLLL